MRKGRSARWAAGVALAALLAGLPAAAAGAPARNAETRSGGGAGFWAWLTAHLPRSIVQAVCDESTYIDPNGRCHAAAAASNVQPVTADQSSLIDPNG